MNYNTGDVSGFGTGGVQAGWNGGVSLSVSSGLLYGLGGSNGNYSGPFQGGSFNFPLPDPQLGGGLYGEGSSDGVVNLGGSLNVALLGRWGGGANWTNSSQPVNLGRFTTFSTFDDLLYILKQLCK